jgi:hypothetical protein
MFTSWEQILECEWCRTGNGNTNKAIYITNWPLVGILGMCEFHSHEANANSLHKLPESREEILRLVHVMEVMDS